MHNPFPVAVPDVEMGQVGNADRFPPDQVPGADDHAGEPLCIGADDAVVPAPVPHDLDIHPNPEGRLGSPVREPGDFGAGAGLVVVKHACDRHLHAVQRHDFLFAQMLLFKVIWNMDICASPVYARAEQDMQHVPLDDPGRVVRRPEIVGDSLAGMPDLADFAVRGVVRFPAAQFDIDVEVLRMLQGGCIPGVVQAVPPAAVFADIAEIVRHQLSRRIGQRAQEPVLRRHLRTAANAEENG